MSAVTSINAILSENANGIDFRDLIDQTGEDYIIAYAALVEGIAHGMYAIDRDCNVIPIWIPEVNHAAI